MKEGELKRAINDLETQNIILDRHDSVLPIIDEAKKEFETTDNEDEEFELQEYGFEDITKLTRGAINLKCEILEKVLRRYMNAKKKWFGGCEVTEKRKIK